MGTTWRKIENLRFNLAKLTSYRYENKYDRSTVTVKIYLTVEGGPELESKPMSKERADKIIAYLDDTLQSPKDILEIMEER